MTETPDVPSGENDLAEHERLAEKQKDARADQPEEQDPDAADRDSDAGEDYAGSGF